MKILETILHLLALVSFLARPKPVFLCSLLRNQTETLGTHVSVSDTMVADGWNYRHCLCQYIHLLVLRF